MISLGLDVGGSSIKGAPVNVATGELAAPAESVPTPVPATPAAVVEAVGALVSRFDVPGPVGVAFPSVIVRGVARTAANIDCGWIGASGEALVERALGRRAVFLNDGDAAGLAEMRLGAGRGCDGTVLLLTFGTGIGSALFVRGELVPNTELGHLYLPNGKEAEQHASGRVRALEGLDWPAWAGRANDVLAEFHRLLWPDVFILGGGLIESFGQFKDLLHSPADIRPARFGAHAGIVGAALAAAAAL